MFMSLWYYGVYVQKHSCKIYMFNIIGILCL